LSAFSLFKTSKCLISPSCLANVHLGGYSKLSALVQEDWSPDTGEEGT